MFDRSWIPIWTRGGPIEEIIWIGKDVLAWASGVHILFLQITQKKQCIRRCIDQNSGDGACCLSAHPTLPFFAFSEKTTRPRIIVLTYPTMAKICECSQGCKSGYLATAFAGNEYLISIGSYPLFPMTIWSWRTGEKIAEVDTSILDEVGQILRVNPIGAMLVAQFGRTCGKLVVWSISIVGKVSIIKDHKIKLPMNSTIRWADWCQLPGEPLLAIVDEDGHVYLSNENGSDVYRIVKTLHCNVCTEYELPLVCWFRGGIILKTTFCQIRYYTKTKTGSWNKEWYIKLTRKPSILVTHPFRDNWLFYHTHEGYLMEIKFLENQFNPTVEEYYHHGAEYRFLDFVHPLCNHIVTTDDPKDIVLLESNSGTEVARMSPETIGIITCQASHPDYPLIILTTTAGELLIINAFRADNLESIVHKRLYKRPLDFIKFSPSGRILVVGYKKSGDCFYISLRDNTYTVMGQVHLGRKIIDMLLSDIRKGVRIFALLLESTQYFVGRQFVIYDATKEQVQVQEIVATMDLPGPFRNIYRMPGHSHLIVGTPYLSRHIYTFKLLEPHDIEIVHSTHTNHNFNCARLFTDRHWLTTTAFDGLLIVRDASLKTVANMLTHHRKDHGSVKGVVQPNAKLAVILGRNGSLVGMRKMDDKEEDPAKIVFFVVDRPTYGERKESTLSASMSRTIINLIKPTESRTSKFDDPNDLTWVESIAKKKLEEEEKACAEERVKIMEDFLALKKIVVDLLNKNEVLPDIERLPVSDFDLDIAAREHTMKVAKDDREDKRLELEYNCICMDNISAWLKKTYWDSQEVLAKSIFTIAGSLEVVNYPLVAEDPIFKESVEFAEFERNLLRDITKPNGFHTWQTYTPSQLTLVLENPLRLSREDEILRMDELLQSEDSDTDAAKLKELRALEGITIHRFIEPSPHYYSQMETYGFIQLIRNNYYLMDDCNKLRAYFNNIFNKLYESKEREMDAIKDKIGRIRHINSELKIMFGKSVPILLSEPSWHIKEKPESIVQVLQHEVKAKPYISPSQQEILNQRAMEAERIRQLMLADDFHERALMAMMDGVLEVRWEDIIKRDIPKPECMSKKRPEDYTADDLRTVKQYHKAVEQLSQERQRYKRILESDYVKVESSLRENVDRFNVKVDELFVMKMKVESALKQMELRYVRACIHNYKRAQNIEKYESIKNDIARHKMTEQTFKKELDSLEDARKSLLTPLETMSHREKALAKKFRSEFPSLGRASTDLLERQYKRRPRTLLKNVSGIDLFDLAKCVATRAKFTHMSPICLEYLRNLEELDLRPSTLPPSIDEQNWEHLVKVRRQRIDLELRMKAQQADIDRAEHIISVHRGRYARAQERTDDLESELSQTRAERILFDLNTEIQLVMRLGQVEIDLNGRYDDTSNAILIPRGVIEDANELIAEAGRQKLKAMEHTIDFHKSVRNKEWEHKTLKMHIEDLQEDLRFVQGTNITREVQIYLKRKAKGLKDDKTAQQMERELETMQNHFDKVLQEWAERLREVGKKIEATRRKNDFLDRMIANMNVVRCEMEHGRDLIAEERHRRYMERKMRMVMKRSNLIKELQDNYAELLALQTEHELLRLRRYPALKFFRRIDEDENDKGRPC